MTTPVIDSAVTDSTVDRAKAGDRRAIEAVFRAAYPAARRVSRALCGETARAERVTDVVFRRALNVLPRWSVGVDPVNWFVHQTVQASRRVRGGGRPASAGADLLVLAPPPTGTAAGAGAGAGPAADPQHLPAYAALVRGVRRLPPQQEEAFLLHHGERLNARLLGVSMDCSTQAAETHLRAADQAVRELVGPAFDPLTEQLRRACAALTPEPDETEQFVRAQVGAWAGRRLRRRVGRLVLLAALAGAAAYGWLHRDELRQRFLPPAGPAGSTTAPGRNP